MSGSVAIVGAGLGGLAAARELVANGRSVVVFDKGRSSGGRVATRRGAGFAADHGAQFFTVRDTAFAAALEPLITSGAAPGAVSGAVSRWHGPFRTLSNGRFGPDPRPGTERFVGVPGMSALPRALADGLHVRTGARVERLVHTDGRWSLVATDLASGALHTHGSFDELVLALPTAQAHALLVASALTSPLVAECAELADALAPCVCALATFAEQVPSAAGGLFVDDAVLGWAAHDGGKPGRSGAATYVLHANATWSRANVERDPLAAAHELVVALERVLDTQLPPLVHLDGHRWRYALARNEAQGDAQREPCAVDRGLRLAVCGDAFTGGRVEGAFVSGRAAAAALLG